MGLEWNDGSASAFIAGATDEALHIVGERVRDDAHELAPRQRTKLPGRGSYPRVRPGYLAGDISTEYGEAMGTRYVQIGARTRAGQVLTLYRGGAGTAGAYGGTRRLDPFLVHALEMQRGRPVP